MNQLKYIKLKSEVSALRREVVTLKKIICKLKKQSWKQKDTFSRAK